MISNLTESEIKELMSIDWRVIWKIDCPTNFLKNLLEDEFYYNAADNDIEFYYLVAIKLWRNIGKECFEYIRNSKSKISKMKPVTLVLDIIDYDYTISSDMLVDALEAETSYTKIKITENLLNKLNITIDDLIEKIGSEKISAISEDVIGHFKAKQLKYDLELFNNMPYSKFRLYMDSIFSQYNLEYTKKTINNIIDIYKPEKTENFRKYRAELKISNRW